MRAMTSPELYNSTQSNVGAVGVGNRPTIEAAVSPGGLRGYRRIGVCMKRERSSRAWQLILVSALHLEPAKLRALRASSSDDEAALLMSRLLIHHSTLPWFRRSEKARIRGPYALGEVEGIHDRPAPVNPHPGMVLEQQVFGQLTSQVVAARMDCGSGKRRGR